jgi:hypothetical protein
MNCEPTVERRTGVERRSGTDRRRRGRPPLSDDSTAVSLRLPAELLERLCRAARRRGEKPSETHRLLLEAALAFDDFVSQKSEPV